MPTSPQILQEIFEKIKTLLKKQCPPMVISKNTKDSFELIGSKPVVYGSKKELVQGMFFVSALMRKDMISFHFFPMYLDKEIYISLVPKTIKYLKGKTCFNFKKPEQVDEDELNNLLNEGIKTWEKLGYLQ